MEKALLKIPQRRFQRSDFAAGLGLLVAKHAPGRTPSKGEEVRYETFSPARQRGRGVTEDPDFCHMRQKEKKTSCYA
jgi:hypothetical protein